MLTGAVHWLGDYNVAVTGVLVSNCCAGEERGKRWNASDLLRLQGSRNKFEKREQENVDEAQVMPCPDWLWQITCR
jgi:hypothetical protein